MSGYEIARVGQDYHLTETDPSVPCARSFFGPEKTLEPVCSGAWSF